MSVEQNKALTQRLFDEVANRGNLDLIDELFAEDFVEHEAVPGSAQGREAVREFFAMMHSAFEGLRMDVEDFAHLFLGWALAISRFPKCPVNCLLPRC